MQNNIKKDYAWNTVGVFAQNAISPLLLIAITRINGIADSGIFSFGFAIAVIFWALGMWGGRTYQVSDVRRAFAHRTYITARILLALVMLIGALAFSLANNYDATKTGVIVTLVLFKAIESIADALYGILQVHNRLYISGKSLLYKAISGFTLFLLIDILTGSLLLSSMGMVAVNILFVFLYDLRITRSLEDIHINRTQIRHYAKNSLTLLKRTVPVFAVLFLSMFSLNIPRYFIDQYHNDQIGYFGILAMPITLIALLMSFVLQPKVVELANLYTEGAVTEFRNLVRKLVGITAVIGSVVLLAAYLIGVPALQIIFGVSFASYKAALLIIVAGGIINAFVSVFINILIIMRRFKSQFYILLATNLLLLLMSLSLIKAYGLMGGVTLFTLFNLIQAGLLVVTYSKTLNTRAKGANS